MKRFFLTVVLLGCLASLGACMWMGPEDKEFFGKGWVNPKELDRAPAPKMPVRPGAGDASAVLAPASAPSDAAGTATAPNNEDWATPPPY